MVLQTLGIVDNTFIFPMSFQKLSNLRANNFSLLYILVQILHLTWCTLPCASNIDLTHGNFTL
jgi:hypothetical protein